MKRKLHSIIALILATVLLVPSICATAEEEPSEIEKKQIVQNMMQHIASQSFDTITREGICYYPEMMDNILSNTPASVTIELVSQAVDAGSLIEISEEKYCEVLVNMMALAEYNSASDIATQKEQDNLKTLQDYGMDVAEMSANAANFMTGTASLGTLGEGLNLAISSLEVLASNTDNWIQALSNLETITQNYETFDLFLNSMQNSTNDSLRSAAKKLQQGMESAMKLKLETYADVSNENFENYQAFFFQDAFFTAVKNTSEYGTDQTLAFFVDLGDTAVNTFSVLKSSWELGKQIGTLIGNLAVGGENLLNRLQEILSAVYIRRALTATMMEEITQFASNYSSKNTEELYKIAEEYVTLARYLVNCDIRGLYCMYSIVTTDAQLLSWLNMDSAQEAEVWYEDKTDFEEDVFTSLFASILETNPEIPPEAVEFNGHYYTIYDFSPLSSNEKNTWENAFDYCEGVSGNMAVINSKEENDFLMSLLDDSPYDQAYFGLRKNEQNNWEWPNGSIETYRNWTSGTENSNRGSYAMLSTDNPDGTWGQGDFIETDGGTAFFCEWEGAFDLPIEENSGSTDPVTVFSEALAKFDGADISITKEGSFLADFVNFSELRFTQKMDIQKFGQPTMTASGHYTSTGGSGGSTSEMDYDFTYDSQGTHIPNYEQPVTGELVTLELPPLECVHSYSETGRDGGGKTYLVTYDGETLTQENCGIFSSVLDSSFRIYWSPSEEYADEDGIQEAEVLFSIDNEGNLVSIEVSYQMYAGIQGIAPVEGTTTFIFNKIPSNDKKDITNYFGTWEADPNVTMELTGKSLMSIYGSGISNGSKLVIGEDGFFSFYIGITQDNQGEGTWKWNGSKFSFTLVSYLTQTEVQGYLTVVSYNGVEYLVMNDQGNDIYWKQVKAQDESQDSESLINIIDTDFVLKSLANVGMGDGQITNTEQFTPENWRTLVSMWLEHSYQAYRDNGINAPTPVQREDYIADDSSHCFFNRDALNDAIELFGGNPKDVLTTLCAQNSGNKAIKNQIVVEDDQLIWTIPESEYEPVFDLHLINIAEDSGKVLLTYGYQYGDFGGWTLVYEGTATLVSSNNPLGYEIESYYRQMVNRNQISSSEPSFVDSSFFDKMPSTPIVVEGSGQDVVVTMTISHLQDFIKYDGGNIDLQFSDGTIALKYTFEVEDNAANVDDSVFILTNNSNSELTWMGSGWDDISCSINGDELSWSCSLPKAAFSVEKIKYIGIDVHTSRSRQHLTTYEYRNGDTVPVETSLESPRFAVDWRGYDEFFQ